MSLRSAAAALIVLAVTTVLAQESSPASAPANSSASVPLANEPIALSPGAAGMKQGTAQTPALSPNQSVQAMENTLNKMHAVLKQMRIKTAANAKDPVIKANLDLWELMIGHLDQQLQDLRAAEAHRADMEARRAAMYKQAEIKSRANAQAAQAAMFSTRQMVAPAARSEEHSPPSDVPAASQKPVPTPAPTPSSSPN